MERSYKNLYGHMIKVLRIPVAADMPVVHDTEKFRREETLLFEAHQQRIRVLDKMDVAAYKGQALTIARMGLPKPLIPANVMLTLGILSVIASAFAGALVTGPLQGLTILFFVIGAIIFFAFANKHHHIEQMKLYPHAEWKTMPYADFLPYRQEKGLAPIPREIEALVARIRIALPNARIMVDFLDLDPFLRVELINLLTGMIEEEYFGIWDEKGFKGPY